MLPLLSTTIYLFIRSLNGVEAHPVNTNITSLPISDISLSILAESVNGTASSQRCENIDNCRTLAGIVQSCLVTILACVWFAVHRNIPAPEPMPSRDPASPIGWHTAIWRTICDTVRNLKPSVTVLLVAFLAPEWVLGWALRQAYVVWRLAGKLEKARLKAIEPQRGLKAMEDAADTAGSVDGDLSFDGESTLTRKESERIPLHNRRSNSSTAHATCKRCDGNGNQCHMVAGARRVAKGDERWTWLHSFFVVMGGFHWYNKDGPLYPLSPANVLELVARGHLVPPTAHEISDRSKGDWLSKGVAIVQTVWFVVQLIARHIEGLPITRLEVMTLAYTVITVAMYVVWWKKPLNVSCAVRVLKEDVKEGEADTCKSIGEKITAYIGGGQDDYVDLRKCKGVPTFWGGKPDHEDIAAADLVAILVAMAFGAVHCIAWHSEFQSHLEQQLWRSSAIAIIAVPLALIVVTSMVEGYGTGLNASMAVIENLMGILYAPIIIVYMVARVILVVLSFTSLKGLPYTAYETVQWSTFIPHI